MSYSLMWLPGVLKSAGLKVLEAPSWQIRGHGDIGPIKGVMLHHTAGRLHASPSSLTDLLIRGRPDLAGPLSQLALWEDGTYTMIASGRGYHAGAGEWQGQTNGNGRFIGIEAANTGLGDDPWDPAQMDAYRRGVAAILNYINAPAIMAVGHKEYAKPPGRKSDPSFDMPAFRKSLAPFLKPQLVA